MSDLYLTPAEKYTAALGGFYYGDLPEPGTVYTQLIKDILDGSTPDKEPKNILARFIYSLYISDLGDPYPRYELAKLLYWKLHDVTPTKSGSILTVTIDGKEDYMTINTDLSRLWYKVLFGSKTDVVTEFPYIFNTMQNKLSDWEVFGNTEVSGTPTPGTPVMPQGTGERTGNLFVSLWEQGNINRTTGQNEVAVTLARTKDYIPIKPNIPYSFSRNIANGYTNLRLYRADKSYIGYSSASTIRLISGTSVGNPMHINQSFCCFEVIDSEAAYIRFNDSSNNTSTKWNMAEGEYTQQTMPEYEPYGYKIPISSANTTTPVYLGEVQTTRRIKQLVLDGTEDWDVESQTNFYTSVIAGALKNKTVVCTHQLSTSTLAQGENCFISTSGRFNFTTSAIEHTAEAFKAYLAAQYAAGTPVTVWYVLAEPETGIVNEPLMKIGEYADSMSRAQTGIDIPTVIGQNTLDVLTTVKPSSMSIEYTSSDENRSRSKRISLLKSPLKKGLIK